MRFPHIVSVAIAVGLVASAAEAQDPATDGTQGSGTGYERELRGIARRERASIESCVVHSGRSPQQVIQGLQFVTVSVGPDGSVSHVSMHGLPEIVEPLELCVNRIASNWRLSTPMSGPVFVNLNRDQLQQGALWIRAH